jgi:hypothetical protein
VSVSQVKNKKGMKTYLANEDYNRALKEYLKQYPEKKGDINLNLSIGVCYLNVNDDKSKAIPYLEFVYKSGNYTADLLLYLGMAYMYNYEFDKAIDFFNDYKSKTSSKDSESATILIENCENAKVLIKKPINITFENLGKEVNTAFPDYYPFVTKDEGLLYFTTRREATIGNVQSWQGYYTSDIYFSKVQNGQWGRAKNAGPILNSQEDEQSVYVSPNGKIMLVYIDNEKVANDLFITSISGKNKNFPKPILLKEPISSPNTEFEACITDDGNILIFNSDRPGGFGGMDLYMSKKLPTGEWGTPVNLGSTVNTKFNEGFPNFDEYNNVLYFASEGHFNIGGYDIFKSKFNTKTQKFEEAVNIGYPINTPEDNMQFSLAGNKRDAYISAYRKEGYGDLDIYKVVFNDIEEPLTAFKGIVTTNDSTIKKLNAVVKITNAKTNEEIESKQINPQTNSFIFALRQGKYIIEITADGFDSHKEEINILDKSDFVPFKESRIVLIKTGTVIPNAVNANKPTPPQIQSGKQIIKTK